MRRLLRLREARTGLVAIYDALLFLMVVILISEGMFLYTATISTEGGGFSDDHYQHLSDTQVIMVEALSLNETYPMPEVSWENGTGSGTMLLNESRETQPEAYIIEWLLISYCQLTWETENADDVDDKLWDTSEIKPIVDAYFFDNQLNGTEHAWAFLYNGEVELYNSSTGVRLDELPEDRWASISDYGVNQTSVKYEAELRYYLWLI
jgi:hypothetical protein